MKAKHLLAAFALPAMVACTQDEALVNGNQEAQYQGKPLENVTFSFNDGEADTRMTNNGWNLAWQAGDQVGLVWTNAPEIQQQFTGGQTYDPTVLPNTAFWASNTRMTCTDPAKNIFEMKDGQVMEGQYFAYYPYSDRYQINSKFGLSVDATQVQGSTDMDKPADVLSYVKENMPWISRRADEKATTVNKNATFIYPLTNNQAGMSKAIDMEMFRFANMLDARISFVDGEKTSINPEDVKILSVDLKVVDKNSWGAERIATSGLFNMSYVKRWNNGANDEFGVPSVYDKTKYELPLIGSNTDGLFMNDELVSEITTTIETPVAKAEGRVNFLLMPYTSGNEYFHETSGTNFTLALDIHTNYGHVVVNEADWYKAVEGTSGMPVWGPETVPGEGFVANKDVADFYTGWANRTGAFVTRYVGVNVDDLAFESSCIKTQEDLINAIERINSREEEKQTYNLCIDGEDGTNILTLTDFDWSATSDEAAIVEFINAGNKLNLNEHNGKTVTIKFEGENKIGALYFTNYKNYIDMEVADNAVLNIDETYTTGILTTAENAILNINGKKLTTGKATLNGKTNINVTEEVAGELAMATSSVNNGTIDVWGALVPTGNKATLTNGEAGTINLYYTAVVKSSNSYTATLSNEGLINYYYAKGKPTNVTITNVDEGQFLATYSGGEVIPGTDNNENWTDFILKGNTFGVTHWIIASASEANSEAWNLSNAQSIIVKKGVELTFNPTKATLGGLTATKATLFLEGDNTFDKQGNFASYAQVYVKNITLAYNSTFNNNIIVKLTGTFQGEEVDGKTIYVVNNNGYVYGGKLKEQSGTITWEPNKFGVQP